LKKSSQKGTGKVKEEFLKGRRCVDLYVGNKKPPSKLIGREHPAIIRNQKRSVDASVEKRRGEDQ